MTGPANSRPRRLATSSATALFTVAVLAFAARATAGDVGVFVDEAKCAACHEKEAAAWRGSHHDLAMQPADASTVLGDFGGATPAAGAAAKAGAATFEYAGVTTRFSRRGDAFVVTTDGPGGKTADFDVRWVFGVDPLQQVLLPLPSGRLQALSVAWDTRAKRWYHLYPTENVDHRDELHWTKASQNWNFMCAECHSTDVDKNYDAATDRYDTRWFQVDVGCQACHGPGAKHVEWAEARRAANGATNGATKDATSGTADGAITATATAAAVSAAEAGLPVDLAAASPSVQVEACARCHSRRSVIAPEYEHGRRLMDSHLPALLEEDLYHVDGQILGEVYEYASFQQSRMAAKGLRCTDCHDAHSGRTKADGDALCVTCHNATGPSARTGIDTSGLRKKRYDSPEHHFHAVGGKGSHCVDCHAPRTVYMGVDARADHSFRIPRPDLSGTLGTPNACSGCHADKDAAWADRELRARRGVDQKPPVHFATALHAGRQGLPGAMIGLAGLATDRGQAAVVRATALQDLVAYPGDTALRALTAGLVDDDPQVRRVAVTGFQAVPPEARAQFLAPLLADPVRGVRIEAARLLLPPDQTGVPAERRAAFDAAVAELEASYRANEDRASGRVGLGDLFAAQGREAEAEAAYRSAVALDPAYVPASVNLADLLRARGDDKAAEAVLQAALSRVPGDPSLQHALALAFVRLGRRDDARTMLVAAAKAAPDRADIAYTCAAALADAGRTDEAVAVLEAGLLRNGGDRDLLLSLVVFERQRGNEAAADRYLARLRAVNPEDPALQP